MADRPSKKNRPLTHTNRKRFQESGVGNGDTGRVRYLARTPPMGFHLMTFQVPENVAAGTKQKIIYFQPFTSQQQKKQGRVFTPGGVR